MTVREKRLLEALFWSALAAAAGIFSFFSWERGLVAGSETIRYEDRLAQLLSLPEDDEHIGERIASVRAEVEAEESAAAAVSAMGLSEFGRLARELLSRNGVETHRYQTIRTETGHLLEFTCRSTPLALASFLRDACSEGRRWRVPYVNIRVSSGDGNLDAVMRIGHD